MDDKRTIPTPEEEAFLEVLQKGFKRVVGLTFTDQMREAVLSDIAASDVEDVEHGYRGNVPMSIVHTLQMYSNAYITKSSLVKVRKMIGSDIHSYYAKLNDTLDLLRFTCRVNVSVQCKGKNQPLKNFYTRHRVKTSTWEIDKGCKHCISVLSKQHYERRKGM